MRIRHSGDGRVTRRLSDLLWHSRIVEIRLQARRFRCGEVHCLQRIFTERFPDIVRPKAWRTVQLGKGHLAIGFSVGGEPGFRLSTIRGDDEKALDQWIDDAAGTELDVMAKGIRRDIGAVRAAITHP